MVVTQHFRDHPLNSHVDHIKRKDDIPSLLPSLLWTALEHMDHLMCSMSPGKPRPSLWIGVRSSSSDQCHTPCHTPQHGAVVGVENLRWRRDCLKVRNGSGFWFGLWCCWPNVMKRCANTVHTKTLWSFFTLEETWSCLAWKWEGSGGTLLWPFSKEDFKERWNERFYHVL